MRLPALTPRFAVLGDHAADEHTEGRVLNAFTPAGVEQAAERLHKAGFRAVTVETKRRSERVRLLPANARKDLRARREREATR